MLLLRWFCNALLVAVVSSVIGSSTAFACFDVYASPAPWIWFTSLTTAQVALTGVEVRTGGLAGGEYCAVGLGHSNAVISSITALAAVDDPDPAGSPVPIPGLSFSANATTTADLAAAAPGSTWQGFHTSVASPLTAGTQVVLAFTITVPSGTLYEDIIDDLQSFGFLGVDEANASGNLLSVNQSFEGIVGVTELPECFDDVIQPGEMCDGAQDLGCPPGDTCVDCSVCVAGGVAEDCKSKLIRDISTNLKKKLKCYARAAKQGLAVDPNCLAAVLDLSVIWPKYTMSCPQVFPPDATITNLVDTLCSDLATTIAPLGTLSTERKCASKKFKAASFLAVAKVKCYSKALARNIAVDPLCLTNADTKYGVKYTAAENLGCAVGNIGNSAAITGDVDPFVNPQIIGSIPP